jgi:hypothetical protein
MNGRRLLVALSAAVLTISQASPALAQAKAAPGKRGAALAQPKKAGEKPAGDKEKKPAGRRVLRLEEMRVEGRVQKPQALFLMPRAGVTTGSEPDRTESFLPKAKDAVEKDPF